jgi:hypothetical protein
MSKRIDLSPEERLEKIKTSNRNRARRWRASHKDHVTTYQHNYFAANRERIYAQRRASREARTKEGATDD